ncbi:hypothetical protein TNCV_864691 [Trichonephila clavipes]|nr:hypothetical protein TNCV_864691 [Trichonephila clavipes]
MLGRRIAAHQPPPTCLPQLLRALLDEWCNIPQDHIDNLILSIPWRSSAVPTPEKFIEENVHIEVQKNIYQKFQQTRLPSNRHSRTPGHERLSTSRREKNKKNDVWSVLRNSSSAL